MILFKLTKLRKRPYLIQGTKMKEIPKKNYLTVLLNEILQLLLYQELINVFQINYVNN